MKHYSTIFCYEYNMIYLFFAHMIIVCPFKAAQSVTFDLLILEIMLLFFKNTFKKLKFRYTFYQFRKS